jgi:hypothetical protein
LRGSRRHGRYGCEAGGFGAVGREEGASEDVSLGEAASSVSGSAAMTRRHVWYVQKARRVDGSTPAGASVQTGRFASFAESRDVGTFVRPYWSSASDDDGLV